MKPRIMYLENKSTGLSGTARQDMSSCGVMPRPCRLADGRFRQTYRLIEPAV